MKKPVWIVESVVLKIHAAQLTEHGGALGVRDKNLLESALHHPQNLYSYKNSSLVDLAAAYAERIIKNHPFVDGNKRTAYVVTLLFLKLNGLELVADKQERVIKFIALADSKINIKEFTEWLQQNVTKLKS